MKKKALSPVIATLLLVLLTIVAVFILWGFIKTFINKNLEETNCFDYTDYVKVVNSEFSCYTSTNTSLQIERSFGEKEIEGIYVSITSGSSSSPYKLINGTAGAGVNNGATIILPSPGGSKTYNFDIPNGNLASITVILAGNKICDKILQYYNLDKCI